MTTGWVGLGRKYGRGKYGRNSYDKLNEDWHPETPPVDTWVPVADSSTVWVPING